MAVLGAMSLLRVRNLPEQSAVPFLLYEDLSLHTYGVLSREDATVRQHLETARDWFYQSALHGRLFALSYIGYIRAQLEGGAVGLGWIEENEYSELQEFEIVAFLPQTIYKALPFEIAPQLRNGPSGIAYEKLPKDEWQAAILAELANQFEQDRIAAELPPISVSESTAPSSEEMRVMICYPFW